MTLSGDILKKIILKQEITDEEISEELRNLCEAVHSCCDGGCPVYEINEGPANSEHNENGCACFKSGKSMLNFIRVMSLDPTQHLNLIMRTWGKEMVKKLNELTVIVRGTWWFSDMMANNEANLVWIGDSLNIAEWEVSDNGNKFKVKQASSISTFSENQIFSYEYLTKRLAAAVRQINKEKD